MISTEHERLCREAETETKMYSQGMRPQSTKDKWPPFKKADYLELIERARQGMDQLEPDGNACTICGDGDHQAFECRFNPLVREQQARVLQNTWRCFHCGKVFTDAASAEDHFGKRFDTVKCRKRCSGYGVFPDGRKCPGCEDCRESADITEVDNNDG